MHSLIMSKFFNHIVRRALSKVHRNDDRACNVSDLMVATDHIQIIEDVKPVKASNKRKSTGKSRLVPLWVVSNIRVDRKKDSLVVVQYVTRKKCVFYDATSHNSQDFSHVTVMVRHKMVFRRKALCFTCFGSHLMFQINLPNKIFLSSQLQYLIYWAL